jgi:hypothetical protein
VTYPVTVTNNGLPGKGVIAEGLTISLAIPADTTVVAATGTGYQGIHTDDHLSRLIEPQKPVGRPPGSRNKSKGAAQLERLVSSNKREIQEIFEHTLKLAKAGEPWAVQAVLDRPWVKPKSRTVTFELPPINTAADSEAALGAILAACGAGKLTPDEAKTLSDIVHRKVEVVHMRVLEERMQVLEAKTITSYQRAPRRSLSDRATAAAKANKTAAAARR